MSHKYFHPPGGSTHSVRWKMWHTAHHSSVSYHHLATQETLQVTRHSERVNGSLKSLKCSFRNLCGFEATSVHHATVLKHFAHRTHHSKKFRHFLQVQLLFGMGYTTICQQKCWGHSRVNDQTFKFCVNLEKDYGIWRWRSGWMSSGLWCLKFMCFTFFSFTLLLVPAFPFPYASVGDIPLWKCCCGISSNRTNEVAKYAAVHHLMPPLQIVLPSFNSKRQTNDDNIPFKVWQEVFSHHLFSKISEKKEQNHSILTILEKESLESLIITSLIDARGLGILWIQRGRSEGLKEKEKARKSRILTPELIVVAAALRLPTTVSGLTDVALVVYTFTVQ